MATHREHRLAPRTTTYVDAGEYSRIGGAMVAIGVLAMLVVLAFYLLNAT